MLVDGAVAAASQVAAQLVAMSMQSGDQEEGSE
jgi:hypothetical protein